MIGHVIKNRWLITEKSVKNPRCGIVDVMRRRKRKKRRTRWQKAWKLSKKMLGIILGIAIEAAAFCTFWRKAITGPFMSVMELRGNLLVSFLPLKSFTLADIYHPYITYSPCPSYYDSYPFLSFLATFTKEYFHCYCLNFLQRVMERPTHRGLDSMGFHSTK